jgi:hypothetical protein
MINAGKPAPDFSAPAYYQGKFTHIGLSQYRDRWVVLYFYGGDYTFVLATKYRQLPIDMPSFGSSGGGAFSERRQRVCSQGLERDRDLEDGARRCSFSHAVRIRGKDRYSLQCLQ